MPITLGTNIAALGAQRKLGEATESLARVYERLSSGQRINHASDDAAGLAVSSSLNADARVLSQGYRNVNDGLSLLSIADGALEQLSGILERMSELATQSSNGIYSTKQRAALDSELQSLRSEYNRIVESTKFNGVTIFDPDNLSVNIQAGSSVLELNPTSGLLRNIGTGSFTALSSLGTPSTPYSVVTLDANGDGNTDFAIGAQDSVVGVFVSNGNGTFKAPRYFATGAKANVNSLNQGDVNGDGITDIISVDHYGNSVSVLLGNGNGTFKAKVSTTGLTAVRNVISGDFNGDGILDLGARATNSSVQILVGNGNGTFSWGMTVPQYAAASGAYAETADFNNDGNLDIVSSNGQDTLSIALGNGNGTFRARVTYTLSAGTGLQPIFIGDFNSDGVLDVAGELTNAPTGLAIFFGNGNGSFKSSVSIAGPGTGTSHRYGTTADFNEDGLIDIVYNRVSSSTVFLSNGNGTFKVNSYTVGSDSRGVATGDFNGDGILDLISADGNANTVTVLLNNTDQAATLAAMDISTQQSALETLDALTSARQKVLNQIGTNGAQESRLMIAARQLLNTRDNELAAASRITDLDIAAASAESVRLSILQQTAGAVLAQANLIPSLALSLIKGN